MDIAHGLCMSSGEPRESTYMAPWHLRFFVGSHIPVPPTQGHGLCCCCPHLGALGWLILDAAAWRDCGAIHSKALIDPTYVLDLVGVGKASEVRPPRQTCCILRPADIEPGCSVCFILRSWLTKILWTLLWLYLDQAPWNWCLVARWNY